MPIAQINGHDMYYEVHGDGPPAVYIGGWDTFCHGRHHYLARGMTDQFSTVIIDYRGLGESTDDYSMEPSTQLFADDIIGLLDHLNMKSVYFVGLVGIGACIGQWVAVKRPDLVRCMVNMGCWTWADPMLSDHLQAFGDIHQHAGFHAFQSMVASLSFKPDYYNANREKLLGSGGVWGALERRIQTHLRFVQACRGHDIRPHLGDIEAPTLVIHAGEDIITGPRTTKPLEEGLRNSVGVIMDDVAHVVAGKEEKIAFGKILFDFLGAH